MSTDENELQKKKSLSCVGFADGFMAKQEYGKAIKFYEKALKLSYSDDVMALLKRAEYLSKVESLGVSKVSVTADAVDSAISSLSNVIAAAPVNLLPPSISNIVKQKHEQILLQHCIKHWMRRWVYSHVLMRVYRHYCKTRLMDPFRRWHKTTLVKRGDVYHNHAVLRQCINVWRVQRMNKKISSVSQLMARRHQLHGVLSYWLAVHRASFKRSRLLKSLRLAIITHYIRVNRKAFTAFKLFRNRSQIASTIDQSVSKYRGVKLLTKALHFLINHATNSYRLRKATKDAVLCYKRRAFSKFGASLQKMIRRGIASEKADTYFKTRALQRWKLAVFNLSLLRKPLQSFVTPASRVDMSDPRWRASLAANIPYKRTIKRWLHRIYQLANNNYTLKQAALYHLLKVFRRLRFNCKIMENKTLKKNRSSMLCKKRMLARSFKRLAALASRCAQLRYMSTFQLLHKRVLAWRIRVDNLFVMKCGARRAHLRFQVRSLTQSLQRWYEYADRKRRIRRCFRVFRAMHPLPVCSAVRRVFAAWKTDFLKYNKVKKVTRRLLINDRKQRLLTHYFEVWFDTYDERLHLRETMFRALKKLWDQSLARRRELQLLVSVVINNRSQHSQISLSHSRWPSIETSFDSYSYAQRMHNSISYETSYNYEDPSTSLAGFLSYHLNRLDPRRKLNRLYQLCTLRQWFGMWQTFHRDNRSASQLHHQNVSILIDEYREGRERFDTVSRKRDLWIQWRRLKAWYQVMHLRQARLESISLKVLCAQYFRRWIMCYNLQVMEKRLLVPNGYRNLLNVRQNDCLQLQTTGEASHQINKLRYSQFSSENVDSSNTSSHQFSLLNDSTGAINRLIGDGSIEYSFAQGRSSVSKLNDSCSSVVDSSKLSLIKRLSQPKRSGSTGGGSAGRARRTDTSHNISLISAANGSDKSMLHQRKTVLSQNVFFK